MCYANKVADFTAPFMKNCLQNATNMFGSTTLPGLAGGTYNTDTISIPEKS